MQYRGGSHSNRWMTKEKISEIWLVLLLLWLLQWEGRLWSLHCCLTEHWSCKLVEESLFHNRCSFVDSSLAIAAFQLKLHDNFKFVYVDAKTVSFPFPQLWQCWFFVFSFFFLMMCWACPNRCNSTESITVRETGGWDKYKLENMLWIKQFPSI